MSQVNVGWRDLLATAKDVAREVQADPRAQQVRAKAVASAGVAARSLDSTRKKVTQEEAWSEVTAAVDDLVEVVIVQQKLIDELIERVGTLESFQRGSSA